MRTAEFARRAVRVVGAIALFGADAAGCASNTAPPGWLRPAEDVQLEARGAWIEVIVADTGSSEMLGRVDGELIAAEPDSLFVLTYDGLELVPVERVRHVKVTPWWIDRSSFSTWLALGTLSTLSHGFGLLLSAPVWLLGGGAAAAQGSGAGQFRSDAANTLVLRFFARFPQGLLPGIDRAAIERGGLGRPGSGTSDQVRR